MKERKIKWSVLGKPLLALLLAIITVWIILLLAGYDSALALNALIDASFKNLKAFGNMLNFTCPLLFTGLGVAIAYRSNMMNIGAEGQFLAGAVVSTWIGITFDKLPGIVLILLMFVGGALAGAIVAYIPAIMKIRLSISEVITTIMFNYIFKYLVDTLIRGSLRNPASAEPQSSPVALQAQMKYLVEGTRIHIGIFLGIAAAVLLYILLFKSFLGYEIRAVGLNHVAARTTGINVNRTMMIAMMLSGGLAGIAGTIQVCHLHYLSAGISPGYGYTAIAVSLLAGNNPLGVIATSLIFGFLSAGATAMQRVAGISSTFVQVFQGLIVLFVGVAATKNVIRFRKKPEKSKKAGAHAESV